MSIEYEVRVLEINKEEMVKKIESLGGEKIGSWIQKRYVYDVKPKSESAWIRLRTNGKKTTLAYKNVEKNTVDGTKEIEVEVSDFNNTNELLKILGYEPKGYQVNKRESYLIENVEIDIDTWPLIPTYMEIEAKNKKDIDNIISKLSIDKNKITTLNCENIYKEIYNINVSSIKNLDF